MEEASLVDVRIGVQHWACCIWDGAARGDQRIDMPLGGKLQDGAFSLLGPTLHLQYLQEHLAHAGCSINICAVCEQLRCGGTPMEGLAHCPHSSWCST